MESEKERETKKREKETSACQVFVFHHQGNRESRETSVQHDFRGLLL